MWGVSLSAHNCNPTRVRAQMQTLVPCLITCTARCTCCICTASTLDKLFYINSRCKQACIFSDDQCLVKSTQNITEKKAKNFWFALLTFFAIKSIDFGIKNNWFCLVLVKLQNCQNPKSGLVGPIEQSSFSSL